MVHELKTEQPDFEAMWNQDKKFEVNDILVLKEYNLKKNTYPGRQLIVKVTYVMEVPHRETYVILSVTTIDFVSPKS